MTLAQKNRQVGDQSSEVRVLAVRTRTYRAAHVLNDQFRSVLHVGTTASGEHLGIFSRGLIQMRSGGTQYIDCCVQRDIYSTQVRKSVWLFAFADLCQQALGDRPGGTIPTRRDADAA